MQATRVVSIQLIGVLALLAACSATPTAADPASADATVADAASCLTAGSVCDAATASSVCSGLTCELNNPTYGIVCVNDGSACLSFAQCCGLTAICDSHGVCGAGLVVGQKCSATTDCARGLACLNGQCNGKCAAHGHPCEATLPCCNPSICISTGHCA